MDMLELTQKTMKAVAEQECKLLQGQVQDAVSTLAEKCEILGRRIYTQGIGLMVLKERMEANGWLEPGQFEKLCQEYEFNLKAKAEGGVKQ